MKLKVKTNIDIKFIVIRKHMKRGLVAMKNIVIKSVIIDPLTKELFVRVFPYHIIYIGLTS